MILRDMGNGPYYTLFRPFHLCSIEVPLTCAMITLRKKSNMVPMNRLVSEVFAMAKKDLKTGDVLDMIGGVSYYSLIDTYETSRKENLLPIGLAKGAKVIHDIPMDAPITMADVEVYPSTVFALWKLQNQWMSGELDESEVFRQIEAIEC
jgi:predicted homoserine dehydrogenase-like protein